MLKDSKENVLLYRTFKCRSFSINKDPLNIKYSFAQMIAWGWSDLTWPHTTLTVRYYGLLLASEHWIPPSQLSLVWEKKYSLRNNKGSVSQTHFLNTTAATRPQTEAERKPHPFVCWSSAEQCRLFSAYPLPPHILHATPPSQLLFVGQWCSESDAAVAAASRRQIYTAGTGNLC